MDEQMKQRIQLYIELLSKLLKVEENDFRLNSWVPTCIECLQFACNNEALLAEQNSLYIDTFKTLHLLYLWIIEDTDWAYIELSQKFKQICRPEEVGLAWKRMFNQMNSNKLTLDLEHKDLNCHNNSANAMDGSGVFKSTYQMLNELSEAWDKMGGADY